MTEATWNTIATVASAVIAGAALLAGWYHWRRAELRRDDVLAWSNEVIGVLETLLIISILKNPILDEKVVRDKVVNIIFETSILIERGRLFFKNQIVDQFGAHKEAAYRGYRPRILDELVVAHQIACEWFDADEDRKLRMRIVIQDCLKKFVSLAQKEVGRQRSASADASKGGVGIRIDDLLENVDKYELEKLKRKHLTQTGEL